MYYCMKEQLTNPEQETLAGDEALKRSTNTRKALS